MKEILPALPSTALNFGFRCKKNSSAALELQYALYRRKMKKIKYHLNFSKHSKFPSDIHSDKLLALTESQFV